MTTAHTLILASMLALCGCIFDSDEKVPDETGDSGTETDGGDLACTPTIRPPGSRPRPKTD